jgi:hypothetical protein
MVVGLTLDNVFSHQVTSMFRLHANALSHSSAEARTSRMTRGGQLNGLPGIVRAWHPNGRSTVEGNDPPQAVPASPVSIVHLSKPLPLDIGTGGREHA